MIKNSYLKTYKKQIFAGIVTSVLLIILVVAKQYKNIKTINRSKQPTIINSQGTASGQPAIDLKRIPRHVTSEDIKLIEQKIPKRNLIAIWTSHENSECVTYGVELTRALKYEGYILTSKLFGKLARTRDQSQNRFEIENEKNAFSIYIYPQ